MDSDRIVDVALDIGAALAKVALEALREGDPAKLRKVTDVLPPGHELRTRAALALEEERARREFEG